MGQLAKTKKLCFILFVLVFSSCTSTSTRLDSLYGKELCAGGGDLCAPNKFYIYKDSTFEYTECGGPGVTYLKGDWHLNKRTNIILQTVNEQGHYRSKAFIDTVFLNLDTTMLKVKNKKTLYMSRYKQLFHVCQ